MATLTITPIKTFISGETVDPTKLNQLAQSTVTLTAGTIVDADISASAAIAASKLAGTLDLSSKTITLPDSNIGTSKIADAAVTAAKLNGAQTGSAPIYGCRAWVNFDGTTADNIGGTYSRTLTTVTVTTTTAHNLEAGHIVFLDFTSGAAVDGTFTVVSVPSTTQFTVTHGTSGTTSGNVTLNRRLIRASGNVASVTYRAAGRYTINFSTAMPDANYATVSSIELGDSNSSAWVINSTSTVARTASATSVITGWYNSANGVHTIADRDAVSVVVIR